MAHPQARKRQLRGLYVFKQMPMEMACKAMGLARTTANNWKRAAKTDDGDDWDAARAAVAMGDDSFRHQTQQLLQDYLVLHQAVMDEIKNNTKLDTAEKAGMVAGLADSFSKTVAAFKRVSPELHKHAVALDLVSRLIGFTQTNFPASAPALLEVLEPFGLEIAKAYG